MRRMQARRAGEGNLFLNDFEVCDRYDGGLAAAARVTCPATLVLGARDQMTLRRARPARSPARCARETITLAAGHALQTEAPDALLAALRTALVPAAERPAAAR